MVVSVSLSLSPSLSIPESLRLLVAAQGGLGRNARGFFAQEQTSFPPSLLPNSEAEAGFACVSACSLFLPSSFCYFASRRCSAPVEGKASGETKAGAGETGGAVLITSRTGRIGPTGRSPKVPQPLKRLADGPFIPREAAAAAGGPSRDAWREGGGRLLLAPLIPLIPSATAAAPQLFP